MSKKLIYLISLVLVPSLTLISTANAELVGWWKFDEGSGTTAYDFSGNGNDGTLEDAEAMGWEVGINGMALRFEGGGYVNVGPDPWSSITTQFTVAFWILGSDSQPLNGWCFGAWGGEARLASCHLPWSDGTVYFDSGIDWSTERISKPAAESEYKGQWRHWTFVKNAETGEKKIYLDGVLWHSGTGFTDSTEGVTEFYIGAGRAAERYPYTGLIDDFRLYDHALSEAEILGAMTGEPWPYAFGSVPKDGVYLEDTWVSMSWSPGDFAVSHDVYLGDNFDAVNEGAEGTFIGNQAETFIVAGFPGFPYPDGLVPGTTYYWRIDEVNDAESNSPWKGDVWSFMIPPKTAYIPDPADAAEQVDPDADLSWTGGFGSKLHTVYFGDSFDEVDSATGGLPQGNTTYTPGPLKLAKTYYWRVDEFDAIETYKGDVWSFTTQGAVGNPNPANGAVDVKQTQILSWSPGIYAASHELYFGTDKDAVKNADTGSPEYKGTRDLGAESYDPGMLLWDTTYYWRIDEVNNTNPDSPWPGILWSFTTANFLIVDDFEDYDAGDNQIWYAWKDGLGYGIPGTEPYYPGNGTGSAVGDENTPSYTEETIVHGGNQSMPVFYDNSVLMYSEVEKTLTYPRDWTENGVSTLSIWFRGNSDNVAETLYVVLNGSAVVTHDNPDAAQITRWTEWTIDLQAFADQGVNLSNVNTIGLGLGDRNNPQAGGSGTMYFDDIRLYPPPPEPAP